MQVHPHPRFLVARCLSPNGRDRKLLGMMTDGGPEDDPPGRLYPIGGRMQVHPHPRFLVARELCSNGGERRLLGMT